VPGVSELGTSDSDGRITHHTGVWVIAVEARLDERLGTIDRDIDRSLSRIPVPPGYSAVRQPAGTEQDRVVRRWIGGLVVALMLAWLILARHLRSWLDPIALLPALALAGLGAMTAAALSGDGMSLPAIIALILVGGLVLRQSTMLLTCAGRRRARGATLRVSVIEAARLRLRPVLLTLIAVAGAMLPLLQSGVVGGSAFAWATLGGMLLAAPATLVLTPVMYEMVVEWGARHSH
jgi:HAE1 family hydrophobic/amphiphilic exporter-1